MMKFRNGIYLPLIASFCVFFVSSMLSASELHRKKLCEIHQRLGALGSDEVDQCAQDFAKYQLAAQQTRNIRAHLQQEHIAKLKEKLDTYNNRFDLELFSELDAEWPMKRIFYMGENYVEYYSNFMMRYIDVEKIIFQDHQDPDWQARGMLLAAVNSKTHNLAPALDPNLSSILSYEQDPCMPLALYSERGCTGRLYLAPLYHPIPDGIFPSTAALKIEVPSIEEIESALARQDMSAWE